MLTLIISKVTQWIFWRCRLEEECDGFSGTTDEETALLEKIKLQHELLDTERKTFEDLEFRLMEGVAHREADREELHKDLAAAELRLLQRRQQLREVEDQQRQAAESARTEAEQLTARRQELLREIEQVLSQCLPSSRLHVDIFLTLIFLLSVSFRRHQSLNRFKVN